ncbi:phosphoribosylformylglycinamidine synthase subunit PurQ [Picosynechococcus sp. PCC 8807]|uniref:phosphoribosylformylglycinamidine synthase subunit PurQ n=1 Tax=Picosynechococcus sp. PCC 8807 TaxID=195248 RepID=UPI0008106131|nr:phosphoribosylformylglycinamidine synthase subunit PurQ [Picosynechococcus sp. PCC 8807]ANV90544.1 phosphoribosylformylglycinamidine synthase I [Picosynechococcus sp. PCC 8807]
MKFGVIVFPGSNCDRDMTMVTEGIFGQPTRMVWHQETDITDIDVIAVPGGFSYGDYLRCGAIARFSPVMQSVIDHANQGKYVLGVCNGFQVLTEVGLLPGALVRNRDLHFICDRQYLRVENNDRVWTRGYRQNQVINIPIAHGEGRYHADPETLKAIEDKGQVLFRYCDAQGNVNEAANPNGSLNNIAGITNQAGNVLGMMPHPERAADGSLGLVDGKGLFEGLLNLVAG